MAQARGYDETTKASAILDRLTEDFGRGHGMALPHVVKTDAAMSDQHLRSEGTHRGESNVLHRDGIAARREDP